MTVCSGSLEHVELALLEGSELSSAVQAHLSTCSSCAAEAETLKGIVAALQASPAPVAPAGLAARLVPLVLAEASMNARRGMMARLLRPAAAFATAFGAAVAFIVTIGTAFVVAAVVTTQISPPASERPLPTSEPSVEPSSTAPATEAPTIAPSVEPTAEPTAEPTGSPEPTPTATPEPTDVPRRTPDPVSPDPSEGESTAPTESTSP